MNISINPEFKTLIPPLTNEEFSQLEKNILTDGCRRLVFACALRTTTTTRAPSFPNRRAAYLRLTKSPACRPLICWFCSIDKTLQSFNATRCKWSKLALLPLAALSYADRAEQLGSDGRQGARGQP
jgi:hypothetical protein